MNAVEDVGDQLVGAFQNPGLLLGIPLALAGAVFMSLGAQYQHRGVEKVERLSGADGASGLTFDQIKRLLTRPSWLLGTLMLGLAVICQLAALVKAPLIVVQPLGAIALVITTLLNARVSGHAPTRQSLTAIVCCVGGIFLFVFFAAIYATEQEVTDRELFVILALLLVVIIILGGGWLILRHRMRALFYVIGAGVLYGFVATLAKVVIKRIEAGQFEWITAICVLALLAAAAVGGYFVQTAYSSGPPDLVIAGLTVVDPLVAVLIGMVVLGEAAAAPPWVMVIFAVAGAIAVWGVVGLARYHPQVLSESQELGIERGSTPTGQGDAGADSSAAARATDSGAPERSEDPEAPGTPPWRAGSGEQP
ncbi:MULTISPECIES: DMT family transporter [unclassified Microbacterium]|uniref:DMT family transporter n=1 Tax=unclassified Microbacterium TaxID=2609290 RepID=UPI0016053080|nr:MULTISPECIES: DMT family transporter [unclassified Microbacterium]QNA94176.1 DMT family transporter [Microbacterium sp. Se63.02b]QYM66063.1 DMT family transporter [Microbacterium sp. Se5.02b]